MNNLADIENLFKQLAFDARNLIKKHNKYKTLDKGTNDIVTSLDLLIEKHCIKKGICIHQAAHKKYREHCHQDTGRPVIFNIFSE